jgi:hypothetical protein
MVSLYFQVTGRFKDFFNYQGSLSEFIRDDYFGAQNLRQFRKMWLEISTRLGFLTVTYEECHQDTEGTLRKVLAYYELEVAPDRLSEAVANAQFGKMKKLENSGTFPHPWLKPRNNAAKVRQGKVGGFRESLSEDDISYLNEVFALP